MTMRTPFTLWDLDDANLIGRYARERATLAVVHRSVVTHGRASMLTVGLGREDETGRTIAVAEGAALVELARAEAARVRAVR